MFDNKAMLDLDDGIILLDCLAVVGGNDAHVLVLFDDVDVLSTRSLLLLLFDCLAVNIKKNLENMN